MTFVLNVSHGGEALTVSGRLRQTAGREGGAGAAGDAAGTGYAWHVDDLHAVRVGEGERRGVDGGADDAGRA